MGEWLLLRDGLVNDSLHRVDVIFAGTEIKCICLHVTGNF